MSDAPKPHRRAGRPADAPAPAEGAAQVPAAAPRAKGRASATAPADANALASGTALATASVPAEATTPRKGKSPGPAALPAGTAAPAKASAKGRAPTVLAEAATAKASAKRAAKASAPAKRAAKAAASAKGAAKAGAPAKATPAKTAPAKGRAAVPESRYTAAEAEALFARLAAALPEPKTELEYVNPFTLLVAVVLSAQATDAGVNKATRALFAVADTPAKMAALGEDGVKAFITSIGLFNMKAKNVAALSRAIVEQHGGVVPQEREALQALPGVGRKSANVVLNVAFGQPTIAVDTHIFRVGNRLGLAPGRTPDDVERALERIVPERFLMNAHHWLILHGRHVCQARRPLCEACVIYDLCKAEERRPLPLAPVAP